MGVSAVRDLTPGFERDIVIRSPTFWTSEYFLRRDGKLIKIEKPDDARASLHREWLLVHLRSNWSVDGKTYPAGALIATDLEAYLKGPRKFDVLFEPTERKSLARFSPTRHHVLLNELDNVRSRVTVLTHQDGRWLREPLPGVPEFGEVSAHAVDPEDSDDYFLETTDFLTPNTLALGTVGSGPAQTLKQLPAFFDAKGLAISQHETVSKDGTHVPYFEVARKDLTKDGKNPTLLNGYGGFEIPMLPSYRPNFRRGLARAGRRLRPRQYPRWRRVRSQVAPIGAQGESSQGLRRLHRRRRGPGSPPGDLATAPGRDGPEQRRLAGGQHAHAPARPLRRDRLRITAAGHEAL